MVSITAVLIFLQFSVSIRYQPVAQMVGVMDSQSKTLNTTYLDYEEQNAILRSMKKQLGLYQLQVKYYT